MTQQNPGKSNLSHWFDYESIVVDAGHTFAYDVHRGGELGGTTVLTLLAGIQGNALNFVSADSNSLKTTLIPPLGYASVVDKDFTLGFWLRPRNLPVLGVIIEKSTQYRVRISAATYKMEFGIYTGAAYETFESAAVPDVTYSLFFGWYDHSKHTAYLQINNNTPVTQILSGPLTLGSGTGYSIGCEYDDTNYYQGRIDEQFLYTGRILSAGEREWIWNNGVGRRYTELYDGKQQMIRSE